MRYPKKRDLNEREIIAALRRVGASVTQLDDTGVPDLLVGYSGSTYLLEVKVPSKQDGTAHRRSQGELTESQAKWWQEWLGCPATIVRNAQDALLAIGALSDTPRDKTRSESS